MLEREPASFASPGNRAIRLARFAVVDGALQKLKQCRESVTPALARASASFVERRGWKFYGASCLSDHAREHYGRTSRWVRELAAIGRGLQQLAGFEAALSGADLDVAPGKAAKPLGRTLAAHVARVATDQTLADWLALARAGTVRQFAAAVRAAREAGTPCPASAETAASPAPAQPADPCAQPPDHCAQPPDHCDDDDAQDRKELSIWLPGPVRLGFEEALDMHRAVCGGPVPVHDFVEALIAEGHASAVPVVLGNLDGADGTGAAHRGDDPIDHAGLAGLGGPTGLERLGLRRGPSVASVEERLAGLAGGWSFLDRPEDRADGRAAPWRDKTERILDATCERLVAEAHGACALMAEAGRRAGTGTVDELHEQIRALLHLDDAIERSIGRLLGWISAHRSCWENLFNGIGHYAEERLGMNRRDAQLRAGVHRRLKSFPLLEAAYSRGDLSLDAASVLLRILGRGPVAPGVESAWLEHALSVRGKRLRDEARLAQRNWFLDVEDDTPPMPADDETWFRSLARFPGATRRRLSQVVEHARPTRRGVPVGTLLSLRLPAELTDRFAGLIADRRLRAIEGLAVAPAASRLAKMFSGVGRSVPAWVGLLGILEEYVDTWDDPDALPRRRFNRVYSIWGWRCSAPGCTRRCSLEAHHVEYRSHGGPDAMWNLITLCAFHHRQGEHGTLASCRGRGPLSIVWRLGHRLVAQWFRNEREWPAPAVARRAYA